MSSPVNMTDLPIATVADDNDLAIIRKNDTTDYKIICANLRNINIAGLPALSNPPNTNDRMIIRQAGSNRQASFSSVGFIVGTALWFYQDTNANGVAPIYWETITGKGDRLLAVKGSSGMYSGKGGTSGGDWQQQNHTLTIAEMPAHTHSGRVRLCKSNTLSGVFAGTQESDQQNNATTTSTGGGGGHNHGNAWRPKANIGILCKKVG